MRPIYLALFSIFTAQALSQDANPARTVDDAKPDKPNTFLPISTLLSLGYQRPLDFLESKKDKLQLTAKQLRSLVDLDNKYVESWKESLGGIEPALPIPNQPLELSPAIDATGDKALKIEVELAKGIQGLLSAKQLQHAKLLLYDEVHDIYGLDGVVTFEPFAAQIQLTPKQQNQIQVLKQKAFMRLKPMLLESLGNSDKKAWEILTRDQQKRLTLSFQYSPDQRKNSLRFLNSWGNLAPPKIERFEKESELLRKEMETQGLLSVNAQVGFPGGYGSVMELLQNQTDYKLNENQVAGMNRLQSKLEMQLNELIRSDEFKKLEEPDENMTDDQLIQLEQRFLSKQSELSQKLDQEAIKLLQPNQLLKLKAFVFKHHFETECLAWILTKKPFKDDFEFSNNQYSTLVEISRDDDKSFQTLRSLVQEELEKDLMSIFDARQRATVNEWNQPLVTKQ